MAMRPTYRMSKSRTDDNAIITRGFGSPISPFTDTFDQPIQASYDDLKRPEARQKLRQQLSGTFPENTRKASQESVKNAALPFKDRFTRRVSNLDVGTIASAKSSSSTVDSLQPPKRAATLDNSTIDLEQAINLLQELKKTATPQELVALHRALLPTKETEVVKSPTFSPPDERAANAPIPVRRRSNIPPGLATRAGFGEDLLRKPEEMQVDSPKSKPKRSRSRWFKHAPSASVSSIAALDLADDAANALVTTPSEASYSHMRGYRPGTLRITNGAASPEPSIRNMLTVASPAAEEPKRDDGYFTASEGRPSLDVMSSRASIDVIRNRRPSEESLPIRDRILNSNKALQQRKIRARRMSGLSLTASKESLRAGSSLEIQTKVSMQSLDRESESPVSDAPTPRFHQRWSHRASQISQEYVSDCELSASPYDDKAAALMNFATRLSTVYDSDADDVDEARGTPEAALSALIGAAPQPLEPIKSREVPTEYRSGPHNSPMPFKLRNSRPTQPQKIDSGYGSDSSFHSLRIKALQDATNARKAQVPEEQLSPAQEHDETASVADAQSLYTFKEIMQSPTLISGAFEPVPEPVAEPEPASGKRGLSLLQLRGARRSSLRLGSGSAHNSSDTVATVASLQSSPADAAKTQQQIAKQQRKLQKPMPASMKKQRKAEGKKARDGQTQKPSGEDDVPKVPSELSAAHAYRLSGGPPTVTLDLTEIKLGFDKSTEDLNVLPVEHLPAAAAELQALPAIPVTAAATAPEVSGRARSEDRKRSKSRHRSKSRGRRRDDSPQRESSPDDTPETDRSWGIARLRNKSQSRTRSQTPKRSSAEVVMSSLGVGKRSSEQDRSSSPEIQNMPAYSDFASVARSLGSGSYDISTNQFKRSTAPTPSSVQHQIQSPWMISTGLIKSKTMKGMNEEAASELARAKSRDVAGRDVMPEYDRPRMATPKQEKVRRASNSAQSVVSVEDRFPDWQRKAGSTGNSPQQARAQARVFSSYAESIPPMPELPADVEVKALKADGMVAKKLRESAKSTPTTSARNSDEIHNAQKPDAAKKAAKQRKEMDPKGVDEKAASLLHPAERPSLINVQVKELSGSSSDLSIAPAVEEAVVEESEAQTPSHEAPHPGWVGWEQQAKLWRQRRESAGIPQGKDAEEQSVYTADSPPMSRQTSVASRAPAQLPSISVQRYITPLGVDNAARANVGYRSSDAAAQHAHSYRDLIVDDKENRPAQQDITRTDTAFSTATTVTTSSFVTVKTWNPADPRPAKEDIPRTESAYSTKSYQTAVSTIVRAKSPGGHVRTTSGKFIPYAPSMASMAERSRQAALAKLTGVGSASTPSLGETIRKPKSSPEALFDRYSGGLDYGWERGAGFNGSAGTRTSGSNEAKRKSVQMSNDYGLDLSDVPVFLQKNM